MRFVRWPDGDAGEFKSRIDILYGYAPVYPELAVRAVHQLANLCCPGMRAFF